MRTGGRDAVRGAFAASVGLALVFAAASGRATDAARPAVGAGRARAASPAGPTPLNPAGPTPRNPAGPTPLNPAGPTPLDPAGAFRARPRGTAVALPRAAVPLDPLLGTQPFVAVVGETPGPPSLGGSFFCRVHDRGFATERFFLDHLMAADGVAPLDAPSLLVDHGGVWIYSGEPDEE